MSTVLLHMHICHLEGCQVDSASVGQMLQVTSVHIRIVLSGHAVYLPFACLWSNVGQCNVYCCATLQYNV